MNPQTKWVALLFVAALLAASGAISLPARLAAQSPAPLTVSAAVRHDVSAPLRSIHPLPSTPAEEEDPESEDQEGRARNFVASVERVPVFQDPVRQLFASVLFAARLGVQFDGQSAGSGSWVVPDTNGAIGPAQFVEWINTKLAVYDRADGHLLLGPEKGNVLWQGFGGLCETNNNGDPIAQFDKQSSRWVLTQHAVGAAGSPSYQCVAVSVSSDATGSYYRYAFQLPTGDFPDYPKISTWPDAYYLTIDEFLQTNLKVEIGPYVCALERAAMLQGLNASAQCFQLGPSYLSLLPSDWDGAAAPPVGSPNYLLSLGNNALNFWQFHVDFANPNNTVLLGPSQIPVVPFRRPCNTGAVCVPQQGTSQRLDSLGDRLMYRLAYRNFGDHESLVANHAVSPTNGVGIRWYEIRSPGSGPVVYQQSTYAPDARYRWMASIAMDKKGNIGLGYSESSSSAYPSIRLSGRKANDPLGQMELETLVMPSSGSQTGSYRWGDYSSLLVDPLDDCTFWFTGQYMLTTGDYNWKTHIVSFSFPGCPVSPARNHRSGPAFDAYEP